MMHFVRLASVILGSHSITGWTHAGSRGLSCIIASFTPSLAAWWDTGVIQQKQQQRRQCESRLDAVRRGDTSLRSAHVHSETIGIKTAWLWLLSWGAKKTAPSTVTWLMVCRLLPGRTCQGHLFWMGGFLRSVDSDGTQLRTPLSGGAGRSFRHQLVTTALAKGGGNQSCK